jgi:hypothetical protein
LGLCERCGSPSSNEVCAFCRLVERAGGHAQPVALGPRRDVSVDESVDAGADQ